MRLLIPLLPTLLTLLVAAPACAQRLEPQGALVYDRKTDLTWQRCSYGQGWDEAATRCTGQPRKLRFDDARKLEVGGWRVPKLDELVSIVHRDSKPALDEQAFPDTPPTYFWATDNREDDTAWYVSFADGRTNHYFPPRTNSDVVRFVRSGRWQRDAGPVPAAPAR